MTETVIVLMLLLLFSNLLLQRGISKAKRGARIKNDKSISFSILIAAKNESKNLSPLFRSLLNLNYPSDKFEIIFIDDNSQDNTLQIARNFAEKAENITILSARDKKLKGKKGALEIAFRKAKFDVIVTTDADCRVPQDWLKNLSAYFDSGADVVIGAISYSPLDTFMAKYAAFESLRNRILIFGLSGLGMSYSASGGNFAFRREVLTKIGGYEKISATLSGDDDLIVQEARKHRFKIVPMLRKGSVIETVPPKTFSELFRQRTRHVSTSVHYNLTDKFILSFWHFLNLVAFYSFFAIWITFPLYLLFLEKLFLDVIFVLFVQRIFNYRFGIFRILLFQILYEILLPFYFLRNFFGKITWKN